MGMNSMIASKEFRVGAHLLVVVGIFALFFLALGFLVLARKGDWSLLAIATGAAAVLFCFPGTFRLKIGKGWFEWRSFLGTRMVQFANVSSAYFTVVRRGNAPQGVAAFWIQPCSGDAEKFNLRIFPVRAAAMLFSALEAHGIHVDVPDAWAARRMDEQIRAVQAKADR
jgi:hypothetical protein